MVVVDTSVWVDSIRAGTPQVAIWITTGAVFQHPFVTAEIGMGSFRSAAERSRTIELLDSFSQIEIASAGAFHAFVAKHKLYGTGIGFADAHLLLSCKLNPKAKLATRDKRLADQAERLEIALI